MALNFQDRSSEDEIDVEYTQNEKEFMDYVLIKYNYGVFELFNIIFNIIIQYNVQ